MASQAARSWAPPAAALPPALAALALTSDGSAADAASLLAPAALVAAGHLLALAGAAWQARRGLLPPSAAVGGFAAGLVLAVPTSVALSGPLGSAATVVAGVLALATAGACAALAARLAPEPTPPHPEPPP